MPDAGKLTDFDDAILAVLHYSASSSLTYVEIKKAPQKKGYDVSEKEVETTVQQLRNRGYLSMKEEKE